ncbi:MAG: hypothetical protein VX294_15955 [Candidatus Latescibacterota bacterium]|nr:hypothetical protein [Candidatus Latescibacterota bacterium]
MEQKEKASVCIRERINRIAQMTNMDVFAIVFSAEKFQAQPDHQNYSGQRDK